MRKEDVIVVSEVIVIILIADFCPHDEGGKEVARLNSVRLAEAKLFIVRDLLLVVLRLKHEAIKLNENEHRGEEGHAEGAAPADARPEPTLPIVVECGI